MRGEKEEKDATNLGDDGVAIIFDDKILHLAGHGNAYRVAPVVMVGQLELGRIAGFGGRVGRPGCRVGGPGCCWCWGWC